MWPELEAPPQYENPAVGWEDPKLPDIKLIWKLARQVGYAVGVHGSLKRDFDLIAVPWTDDAVCALDLMIHLKIGLGAKIIGEVVSKPHGRKAINLQLDGYYRIIDLSIVPVIETQR